MSPAGVDRNKVDEIELTITIQKDACIGYGMKVFSFYFYFLSNLLLFLCFLSLCDLWNGGKRSVS